MYSRHCNGSIEWAKYLHKLFTELSRHKGKLTVKHLPVEDMTCLLPAKLESEIYNARLQLVIVSPLFLQWVYKNPNQLVGRLLQQDRVIALLLGVREEQVCVKGKESMGLLMATSALKHRPTDRPSGLKSCVHATKNINVRISYQIKSYVMH